MDDRPPPSSRCALLLFVFSCLAVAARAGDAEDLRAAVRSWRTGATAGSAPAGAVLPGWPLPRGRAAAASVVRRDRHAADAWSDAEVLAASLFLTARGRAELEAGGAPDAWFGLAGDVLGSVADAKRGRSLQREWTLALAAYFNARLDGGRSRELLDRAARTLSDEPEVLLAAAWLHEAIAGRAFSGLAEVVSASDRDAVQSDLLAALRLYEQGLQRAPGANAARLHRARVLLLLGRPAGARRELAALRAAATDPDEACLAALFLGAAFEQDGRSREALAAYRAALGSGRSPQIARLAIAHLLRRTADAGAARRVIEEMLAETPASGDAWWRYQGEGFAERSDHAARFAALWREAAR